ncbi:MAG: PEGA domain-containing protein [Alistipes sp.]|nr:PEGA domain-containing protein [Alistipes sp.]
MKRFLFAILTLIAFTATAQMENSIVLDAKSFRAVQQDALTGVNIDPIGVDHSRQACARIKIKFDRMSKAQIDALEVKMRSNTDLTKQKVADYYDNVLILEMTAKPNTRFYFYSPEFGESNEVALNLEGNSEYEMLASLNQTFSIVVSSNAENVDIYLDDVFKGKTDGSKSLTIKEVMIGAHTLKAVYGTVSSQQSIEVNSGSILFRQNVDTAASRPQFVVFAVEPQSAVVTIEGKHYSLTDGAMRLVLESGTYNYTVSAAGYHSQSGTFTVAGSKVTKQIALTADAAIVTLTVADNAEIWVNGERVGAGRWSGTLNSGTYIFEAKKAGHSTTTTSKHITSDNPQQSYTLEPPKPLFGSLIVDGSPLMADVAIDGVGVGQMPLSLDNLLVGEHKITVSKSGYQPYSATITIAEGKAASVNITLTKQTSQTSQTSSSSKIYKVGDYYNDGVKEGVVFEVSADGRHGKIVSMKRSAELLEWSSDSAEQKRLIGANSETNGAANMAKVKSISGWRDKYPAFKWCADLGEGWYLPSKEELHTIYKCKDKLNPKLTDKLIAYWSSTEDDYKYSSGEFCAWLVDMDFGNTNDGIKYDNGYVRAVSAF